MFFVFIGKNTLAEYEELQKNLGNDVRPEGYNITSRLPGNTQESQLVIEKRSFSGLQD
jgi:hypothetical protein